MPRLAAKPTLIVLALLLLIVVIGGIVKDYTHVRRDMWSHAAAITGGVPRDVLKVCAIAYELARMNGETEVPAAAVPYAAEQARLREAEAAAEAAAV